MTIFSKIISGQIPSYKVAENDKFFAFLDISPMAMGHTLVVPKIEIDKISDLPTEYLSEMLVFAQPIMKAIEGNFDCNRCGLIIMGLEVPHVHLHLVPINSADDLNFTREKLNLSKEEFERTLKKLLNSISPSLDSLQ